jgi:hypothetical protein
MDSLFSGKAERCPELAAIGCRVILADIYEKVEF